MKIGIISTVNQKHMTLISHFTDILDFYNIKYDLIYFDRYKENETYVKAEKKYKYDLEINKDWIFLRKVWEYFKGRNFLIKKIKNTPYDYLIIWNTFTGVMLLDFLSIKYKKKYFLNIRDYSFEKNPFIYFLVRKLIKNSNFTTISSPGFETFLPSFDYLMVHSINKKILKEPVVSFDKKNKIIPLRITFIGNVRFFEQNKMLLLNLKNDSRFILQYFGTNSDVLKEFSRLNKIENVKFLGSFNPLDTEKLLLETDILNNVYGNNDIALETAISIRLYYSAFMKIPILTSPNTFMSEIVNKSNLGFDIDSNSSQLGDLIYEKYHSLNIEEFNNNANAFMEKVWVDNMVFKKTLINIIKEDTGEEYEKDI